MASDDVELGDCNELPQSRKSGSRLSGIHVVWELDQDFVPQPNPFPLEPFIKALENPPAEDTNGEK